MRIVLTRTFRSLRHANFRLFFIGQSLSMIGTWLQQVAMGWLTYRLTGSAWLLGVVAFCANIGILAFGPLRRRARRPRQQAPRAVRHAVDDAAAGRRPREPHRLRPHRGLALIVACALWLGTVFAFDVPLRQAIYVHLVDDRADLPNAIALNSFMVNGARVIGPALAGLLLSVVGEAVCFALNALSFVAVIVAIARLSWPSSAAPAPLRGGWWASWKEGARYVAGFPPVRALLVLVAVAAWTITPYSSLMPIYAGDIYGGGAHTLGFLLSAAGAGALASTFYLASRHSIRGLGRVIAGAAALSGLALAGFAYLDTFAVALLLMSAVGGGVILAAASANTIIQTVVDDRLRGRVAGFYTMAFLGVAPLGNLAAGALANAIGVRATFAINGLVCAATAFWFWRRLPALAVLMRPVYRRLGIIAGES